MTDTDALLADHSPEIRRIFGELMRLCRDAMPGATEQLDLPDRLLAFGFGPPGGVRMRDFAVALIPHAAHVNVQLADGALLDDPTGIVEGTGKRIRHVKCRSLDDAARPALRALLVQQAAHRQGG
ncbi:MAG TPA: DUF1801 domain-containing protein [Candidatus Limnocylindria bacterium]|nr:DUF1801 domain-containing protein [Candidatus Limnocylindria bacterium]